MIPLCLAQTAQYSTIGHPFITKGNARTFFPHSYRDSIMSILATKQSYRAAWHYESSYVSFLKGKYPFIRTGFDSFLLMFNHRAGRQQFQI